MILLNLHAFTQYIIFVPLVLFLYLFLYNVVDVIMKVSQVGLIPYRAASKTYS